VGSFSSGQIKSFGVLNSFDITWNTLNTVPVATVSIAPPFVIEICIGNLSPLSKAQVRKARPICLRLVTQLILGLLRPDLVSAVRTSAAKIRVIEITRRSSTNVKARAKYPRACFIQQLSASPMPALLVRQVAEAPSSNA